MKRLLAGRALAGVVLVATSLDPRQAIERGVLQNDAVKRLFDAAPQTWGWGVRAQDRRAGGCRWPGRRG